MPRVAIAVQQLKRGVGDGMTTSAPTVGDPANDHFWFYKVGDLLIVRNINAGSQTVDVLAVNDPQGRNPLASGKSTKSVPGTTGVVVFDLGNGSGWIQGGADAGQVFVDVGHADLLLEVLRR